MAAVAPSASALATSLPRANAPSTNTGTRPATLSTTEGSTSMGAGALS